MLKKIHNFWITKIQPRIINFLLFITKGEILNIVLATVITLGILGWTIMSKKDVADVVDISAFSAVVLEGALIAVVSLLRNKILNYTEDPNKLTTDYQALLKRYSSEQNFVWKRNNSAIAVIPVVHTAWLYNTEIEIIDHPEKEYELPDIVEKHFKELFAAHLTSKIYNNINIRIDDWYLDDKNCKFKIFSGRMSYYKSLVTNRTMDYELEKGISIRELLECGPIVHPLKYSLLSNHLGVNGFVESSDGKIMFVYRKNNVSIGKRTYSNSIGASIKTKYALNDNGMFTKEGLEKGIVREIEDELGIPEKKLLKDEKSLGLGAVRLIAAYRDMLEGGKPQLLFYVKTEMNKEQIEEAFNKKNNYIRKPKSNSIAKQNEKEMETDGDILYWISKTDFLKCEVYSGKLVHNGLSLPMVPSASACIVMFQQFLEKQDGEELSQYAMHVKKCFIKGKYNQEQKCEDAVFIGKRLIAVIDGVTAKGKRSYGGKTSGKFASDVLVDKLKEIDYEWGTKSITPVQLLESLNKTLKIEAEKMTTEEILFEDCPRASIIIFDCQTKTVIDYGDCRCKIGNKVYLHIKEIDEILSQKRAKINQQYLSNGKSTEELMKDDIGRKEISADLLKQFSYENIPGKYGYPVLNGEKICEEMIKIYPVKEGNKVILCTDGYPVVGKSWEESEAILEEILIKDPLLIGEYKSTKGIQPGANSFDDRTWVEIG